MDSIHHELRLPETISPFGVGAITDIRGESLIAPDTSWWDLARSPEVHCTRLMERLGAGVLREAPTNPGWAAPGAATLRYWRFPAWRFCERCERLGSVTGKEKGKWDNHCECGGFLVPMRFVAVCDGGSHIQDIPWFRWAHACDEAAVDEKIRVCRAYKQLRFRKISNAGEGLGSLFVVCDGCEASRPLSELVGRSALSRDRIRCEGRQPWEDQEITGDRDCPHDLVATQRGATGNYMADRISALEIPEARPASVEFADKVRSHVYFQKVVADNGGPQSEVVAGWIRDEIGGTVEEVLAIAQGGGAKSEEMLLDLKDGEWAAFVGKLAKRRDQGAGDFVVDGRRLSEAGGPVQLLDTLSGVGQVRRLREVRALRGFRRFRPDAAFVRADLGPNSFRYPTYPAIDVYGEGIFLRFDEEKLSAWEAIPEVRARAAILKRRREELPWAVTRLDVPEPRYVALHTFAHLLIRRLAFESGYSSASLQERIYANPDRVDKTGGVLIYTAAGDAQGTLGGLVRLGEPARLVPLIVAALEDADLCSNDPVCIESDRQGVSQLNLSACHGCALVSETSCETANRLLDRQLVLGGSDVPGLFDGLLAEIRAGRHAG
ncbi:MAG: DUF1998 domain-containing protein [Actinobacteria bacterium]|nr:DUF1998 domain-containing protein [Actinomycetota bacterium]